MTSTLTLRFFGEEINLDSMKQTSKTIIDRHHIVQLLENEYESTLRLLKIVFEKIKASAIGNEPIIDVLLIRKGISFFPNANIGEILRILQYEKHFDAFIKLNHSYSCNCDDPPCCRWLTVKNTWAFSDQI